jgi:hypothetical protein
MGICRSVLDMTSTVETAGLIDVDSYAPQAHFVGDVNEE